MSLSSRTIPAPKSEAIHGSVDGLNALIWPREDGTLWWCWLDGLGELLATETHYVGWLRHSPPEVCPLSWRAFARGSKVVLVNGRPYPWDSSGGAIHPAAAVAPEAAAREKPTLGEARYDHDISPSI